MKTLITLVRACFSVFSSFQNPVRYAFTPASTKKTISLVQQRSAVLGEKGSSTVLYALHRDRVTLTYHYPFRGLAPSISFGWFIAVAAAGRNDTPISVRSYLNAAGFRESSSGLKASLDFTFDSSIPDGSSFRPLVIVTTVTTDGVLSSSSSFAGSVTVKVGGTMYSTSTPYDRGCIK